MTTMELQDVSVQAGDRAVVHKVSLTLTSGKVAVLMGPNGSGKSTLVNALMGHPQYVVTSGTLVLDGENILPLPTVIGTGTI